MTPIAAAVEPRRAASVERALFFARKYVAGVAERLAANGMDIDAAFPRPNGRMDRKAYVSAKTARNNASSLVAYGKPSYRMGEPKIVSMDEARIACFLDIVAADAAAQFDAYVGKLESKVGEADEASIDAAPLWNGSILTVRVAGEVQRWKTQMILNVSCLGTLFNQWPTRRIA